MKTRIMFIAAVAVLLVSCELEDRNPRFTGFDVPELTDGNTIQFTASVKAGGYAYAILDGGRIAVDWGDGTMTKDMNPGDGPESWRMEFTHVYKQAGEYRIKIWSDEVEFVNILGLTREYSQLHVGNCPELRDALFNSFPRDKTLDLGGCTGLEYLNLGNWAQLESVDLAGCAELGTLDIYTNPALKTLDLGTNGKLHTLNCTDCAVEDLTLPGSVVDVICKTNNLQSVTLEDYKSLRTFDCTGNANLASLSFPGCDALSVIRFSGTRVDSFDFAAHPELTQISCGDTGMTAVDVTGNEHLAALSCARLGLTSLDVTLNPGLQSLDCAGNKLSSLDASNNQALRYLSISENELDKEALETIFEALPAFDPYATRMSMPPKPQPSVIVIYGNPGAETCDTSIITGKGWVIKGK